MKLIVAVVQNEDANDVVDALLEAEFRTTRLASRLYLHLSLPYTSALPGRLLYNVRCAPMCP